MGQLLPFSDKDAIKNIPESLKTLEDKGFLNAAFSVDEVVKLLEGIGCVIDSSRVGGEATCR